MGAVGAEHRELQVGVQRRNVAVAQGAPRHRHHGRVGTNARRADRDGEAWTAPFARPVSRGVERAYFGEPRFGHESVDQVFA